MKNFYTKIIISGLVLLATNSLALAAAVTRTASGANPAAIQATVDQFRTDLGTLNPNTASTFTTGRREINWDGVPDSFSAPNFLPFNFFNVNSPRGVVFSAPSSQFANQTNNFVVSSNAASGTPVRFGNIDASYSSLFQTFSAERLFTIRDTSASGSPVIVINFFIPGTNIPATVGGFGAVLSDVDSGTTTMRMFGTDGSLLQTLTFPVLNNGLSFLGASFNAGERIARVEIRLGTSPLLAGNIDGVNGVDVVAMDDFIYGEPRAMQFHSGDFDGDGVTDSTVYRPSSGTWFTLNSGTNTFIQEQFGLNGDVPVDGDFDGDSRADLAIFRPSTGVWFFKRSSNGTTLGAQFGQTGDKPVVGDYDKDGKSDIAIWRPSNGNFFVLRSSTDFSTFFGYPFGTNGDIPVQGGAQ